MKRKLPSEPGLNRKLTLLLFPSRVGVSFLLAAFALLLVTTLSAPAVGHIAILEVKCKNQTNSGGFSSISFGTFGYSICDQVYDGEKFCVGSAAQIGYDPTSVVRGLWENRLELIQNCAIEGTAACRLTFLMVLHPLACGLSLFAFLFSMGKRISCPQFGVVLAAVAWILSLIVTMTDFVVFGLTVTRLNKSRTEFRITFSTGMWTCMAAMLLLLLSLPILQSVITKAKKSYDKQTGLMRWSTPVE